DGGDSWRPINQGLENKFVLSLVVHPSNPDILYVGVNGGGIFTSRDGGESWSITAGIEDEMVTDLVIDPIAPNNIYAAAEVNGLFTSVDDGANWATTSTDLAGLAVDTVTLDPTAPSRLYVGTSNQGVFISNDSGLSWSSSNAGFPILDSALSVSIQTLAVDPVNTNIVYAGTTQGIFRSMDNGASWAEANAGFCVAPCDITVFNIAVATEIDMGMNLSSVAVYASTTQGIFAAFELATPVWQQENLGLPTGNFRGLAISPVSNDVVFAGSEGNSVFRTLPENFSEVDVTIDDFGMLTADELDALNALAFFAFTDEELALLPPEALTSIDPEQFGNFTEDALAGLTSLQAEMIPSAVFGGLESGQLGGLDADVLEVLTPEDLAAFNELTLLQAEDEDLSRFLTNLNESMINPSQVTEFLPPGWSIDMNTGELTAPVGTELFFEVLDAIDETIAELDLPDDIPNINSSFGLGGAGGTPLMTGIDQILDTIFGVDALSFTQESNGVMSFSSGDLIYSLLPEGDSIMQTNAPQAGEGFAVGPDGQIILTTPSGQQVPFIPSPLDPVELQTLFGGQVRIGKDGDVVLIAADGSVQVLLFDPLVLSNSAVSPGVNLLPAGRRQAGQPIGSVVYSTRRSQQVRSFIPEPAKFEQALKTILPGSTVTLNYTNGTINVQFGGASFLLTPTATNRVRTLGAREKVATSIAVGAGLTLNYTVQSMSDEMLSTISYQPQ
ncbi:MAG: hypothetical protein AAF512_13955, partial [Pseudomonadota bacterium]